MKRKSKPKPLTPKQLRKKRWAEYRQRARKFGTFLAILAIAAIGAVLVGLIVTALGMLL